jgi:uncharacterized membrane protein
VAVLSGAPAALICSSTKKEPPEMMKTTCLLAALLGAFPSLMGQTQFAPLPYFSRPAEPNAITRDGSKAVGYSYSGTSSAGNAACWWTSAGIVPVPGLQNWYDTSAYGISADGNVIVGEGNSTLGTQFAWYWTPQAGQLQQVPIPGSPYSATARAVTGDGKIVVGVATFHLPDTSFQSRAFRWDRSQAAAVLLPHYSPPPNALPNSAATGVSDDGRRIVGVVLVALGVYAAARWDDGGNPVLFSQGGDTIQAVTANAISPDGSVVVGSAVNTVTGKGVAFKWTSPGGVVALPNPTTGYYAIDGATALNVSGDGSVLVGYGQNVAGDEEAIFWVNGLPYRVSKAAFDAGVLPPSWEPFRATGVDYFGNTIVGWGRGTSGAFEAYALTLDATPPSPPLAAPTLRPTFNATTSTLSIRYQTVPGLSYRVHGGHSIQSLAPLGDWSNGIGLEQEYSAGPAVTGGAAGFFLSLEVRQN